MNGVVVAVLVISMRFEVGLVLRRTGINWDIGE
jgi:hypothetical protein